MQLLTNVILAAFLASPSFSKATTHPKLGNRHLLAMADGVIHARTFMEAHYAQFTKRDCLRRFVRCLPRPNRSRWISQAANENDAYAARSYLDLFSEFTCEHPAEQKL
ncbi:hypothetical protein B0H17DRAFT_1126455 [Mycena rosella]|uniref:Uncharacterized protein n=1 Tax=Mycena rosella TaxID=1033263 RepID=A0AAD7M7U1_MYCRO|nr:hypothetical protein B0H17DRAFT_1126455 [Mycena rosella]